MVDNWEKLHSEYLGDFRIFRIRTDSSRSPRTGNVHHFFVLEASDWVNVIPLTPEGNVVMIYQYRHGTEEVTLEVPAGMVDAADGDPVVSAARELREETGYEAEAVIHLGTVAPNPAFLDNHCHHYLAVNVRRVTGVHLDETEDIVFVEVPLADIPALISAGRITHSLTITAFYYLERFQEESRAKTQRRGVKRVANDMPDTNPFPIAYDKNQQ
jgi:8-oxo-dGTP pyrophosphatase MutT (NUDIX family)